MGLYSTTVMEEVTTLSFEEILAKQRQYEEELIAMYAGLSPILYGDHLNKTCKDGGFLVPYPLHDELLDFVYGKDKIKKAMGSHYYAKGGKLFRRQG